MMYANGNSGCGQSPIGDCSDVGVTLALTGKGWIVDILPFIEEQALADGMKLGHTDPNTSINRMGFTVQGANGLGMGRAEVRDFVTQQLPILTCPSDASATPRTDQFWWGNQEVAVTSYKGSLGDSAFSFGDGWNAPAFGSRPDCHDKQGCNGMFFRNSYFRPIAFKTVTDGLSKTFLVGEAVPEYDHHSAAFFSDGDWASCAAPLNFFEEPEAGLTLDEHVHANWWEFPWFP